MALHGIFLPYQLIIRLLTPTVTCALFSVIPPNAVDGIVHQTTAENEHRLPICKTALALIGLVLDCLWRSTEFFCLSVDN
jgi:hypothetical protein